VTIAPRTFVVILIGVAIENECFVVVQNVELRNPVSRT
jgi:hypothetical protein